MTNLSNLAYRPVVADTEDGFLGKVVDTGSLNWANDTQYNFDPTTNNQLLELAFFRCVFVYNPSSGITTITVNGSGQIIAVPENSQGWFRLLCSDRPTFTIANSSGNLSSRCWFSDVKGLGGSSVWAIA